MDEFNRRTDYRYSSLSAVEAAAISFLSNRSAPVQAINPNTRNAQLNYRFVPPDAETLNFIVRQLLKGWTNETILREPAVVNFAATGEEKQDALIRLRAKSNFLQLSMPEVQ